MAVRLPSGSVMMPGWELVAAGVTLRMTDLLVSYAGLVRPQLPAPAQTGAAGLMEEPDRPITAGVSHHRPAVLRPGPAPTTSSPGKEHNAMAMLADSIEVVIGGVPGLV